MEYEDLPYAAAFAIFHHIYRKRFEHTFDASGKFLAVFGHEPHPVVEYKATFPVNNGYNNFRSMMIAAICGYTCFVGPYQLHCSNQSCHARQEMSAINNAKAKIINT